MKKILIINPYMNIGGVEKSLISLLNIFDKEKYSIDLLLLERNGELLKFIPKHVNIIELPVRKNTFECLKKGNKYALKELLLKKHIWSFLKLLIALLSVKIIKNQECYSKFIFKSNNNKYDYIFNYPGPHEITSILAENVYQSPQKYIWVHNEYAKSGRNPKIHWRHYKKYQKIFCVSKACEKELKNSFPKIENKIFTLYNIIDKNIIIQMGKEHIEEKDFYEKNNELVLLSVGRLSYQKGFDMAIEVCKDILDKGYKLKWYIIGNGEEKDSLTNMIIKFGLEDNMILLGSKINPYPYFSLCDIYIQPSRFEGYGITVAEAKIFNKPIVCTNFAGAEDQIINNETGIIVNFSKNELSNAIINIIKDNDLRNSLIKNLENLQSKELKHTVGLLDYMR